MDGSKWYESITEMDKKINVKAVNNSIGKQKKKKKRELFI